MSLTTGAHFDRNDVRVHRTIFPPLSQGNRQEILVERFFEIRVVQERPKKILDIILNLLLLLGRDVALVTWKAKTEM
jgi:hypothetical protein